ncbi:dnaJ homolog subfamily C member 22 [Fopius arisanus]|uniref:DnaJ homolog subfamily C member 22 n=1 Tax=Fopius arisanus TaxID=64838 RepID=A0A9R1TQU9_9HYME|nr:PREDICTED: dnaJ homolog subfamily C member 22 [Fopius arisanus]
MPGKNQVKTNGNSREEMADYTSTGGKKKSNFVAYFLWMFGGFFGAHHLYLERIDHAIVWATTMGGYFGIGCFRDMWRIPTYVKDANEDPNYIEIWKIIVRQNRKPPFSTARFIGALATGHLWGELVRCAIPEDEMYGINFKPLLYIVPAVIAVGVWVVGNIGREQGSIWLSLMTAYMMYPLLYYIGDESTWVNIVAVITALAFDTFSKEWRLKPKKRHSVTRSLAVYTISVIIFWSLLTSYFYFNATLTDSEGEEIKVTEAVKHFFTSPIWLDLKVTLGATWEQAKNQGFWATWRQLVDLSDPRGEINAYRVLDLSTTASESEITAKWRTLSKEHHPDKVKGNEDEKKAAQERFMEIQQAYEILSKKKTRRQRKNRRAG